MKILITNDDGVESPLLGVLRDAFAKKHKVTVVAPSSEKSAISHSLTLYSPLLVKNFRRNGVEHFAVDGTPVDSVKVALTRLLPYRPDFVVSGINNGLNTGSNIFYSGTVAGALEASSLGVLGFAVSLDRDHAISEREVARKAVELILRLYKEHPYNHTVFNINFPANKPKGILSTIFELKAYQDVYVERRDPRGRRYFWLRGHPEKNFLKKAYNGHKPVVMSDAAAVDMGYISITPIKRDITNYELYSRLKQIYNDGQV